MPGPGRREAPAASLQDLKASVIREWKLYTDYSLTSDPAALGEARAAGREAVSAIQGLRAMAPQGEWPALDGLLAAQAQDAYSYCKLLERDGAALERLRDFLTINVSAFFRNGDQFRILARSVLPELLRRSPRLQVWSAGCSIGAEAYTLAMVLEGLAPGQGHRLLATDLDEGALARAARGGPYTAQEVAGVEPRLFQRHFTRGERHGEWWVSEGLRRRVEFRRHNLLADPYGRGFDLVLCRNVVIYFTEEAKARLALGFHHALKEGGVLFMGAAETLPAVAEAPFERLHLAFYRKPVAACAGPMPA